MSSGTAKGMWQPNSNTYGYISMDTETFLIHVNVATFTSFAFA